VKPTDLFEGTVETAVEHAPTQVEHDESIDDGESA